ncbi:MAG: hypothetical protein QY318_03445 [Candidatus Dojkabacteria bacterium]|nr:MAG: hypothetical protein QY318_03445 [Candidatus Dojkabacteria bacterium]
MKYEKYNLVDEVEKISDHLKVWGKFGWKEMDGDFTKKEWKQDDMYEEYCCDLQRDITPATKKLSEIEGRYIKLQKEINRSIWTELAGKPKWSKSVSNLLGCSGLIVAFVLSWLISTLLIGLIASSTSFEHVGVPYACLLILNFILIISAFLFIDIRIRKGKIRRLRPRAKAMYNEDKEIVRKRAELKYLLGELKKLSYEQKEIDHYFKYRVEFSEVGYGFPLYTFEYYDTDSL